MARKEDGMQFEVHPTPLKDKKGNNYVCVKPRTFNHRTMEDIDDYCSRHFAMRPGEMTRAFNAFRQMSKIWLAWGDRLETPIGTFSPRLGLKSEKTTADRVRNDDVYLKGIGFEPSKEYVDEVDGMTNGYRHTPFPSSLPLAGEEEHLLNALRLSIDGQGGYTTVSTFKMFSHLSDYAARQVLDRWCEEPRPRLMRSKIGRTYVYTEI